MAISTIQPASIGYAGAVLQVVNSTYSTGTSTTSTSNVATGLTATITPRFATSKILVLVNQSTIFSSQSNGCVIQLYLYRDGATQLNKFEGFGAYSSGSSSGGTAGSSSTCYLDSPATTSAVTYATYQTSSSAGVAVSTQYNGGQSTITLLEIAG